MIAIKMDKVAGNKNDEYYTPEYAIYPLLKYLAPPSDTSSAVTIWCPFDTQESNYVKIFSNLGYRVIASHINEGKDFFHYQPSRFDYVISNPPYSRKGDVIQRLFELNKPFAMLVGVVGLFESQKRFDMFRTHDFELMYFNKRIAYYTDENKNTLNHPLFSSVYVCNRILPKQIIFEVVRP